MLGEALEAVFGADLTIGPAIDDGFYYDCFLGDRTLGDSDKDALNKKISEVYHGISLALSWQDTFAGLMIPITCWTARAPSHMHAKAARLWSQRQLCCM